MHQVHVLIKVKIFSEITFSDLTMSPVALALFQTSVPKLLVEAGKWSAIYDVRSMLWRSDMLTHTLPVDTGEDG